MKKLLGIIVFGLLLGGNAYAEELYLRCIPEITTVRHGDFERGTILQHRILYAKFKMEYDLTKSDEPKKVVKKLKTYLINSKGKKDKSSYKDIYYSERNKSRSFDFVDRFEGKTFKSFLTMNINYDGSSWVGSGNINITQVVKDELIKENISWFGQCYELTKKQFKKPMPNQKFVASVK
tara:strand:+ start:280 stop:816 length:537 start_codon:yes stop_codon:yes gene_type:complete